MSDAVHSRTSALEAVARGLVSYESRTRSGLAAFDTALRKAVASVGDEVNARRRNLASAEAALRDADEESIAEMRAAVERAQSELRAAERSRRTVEDERERFLALRRKFEEATRDGVARGRSELRQLGVELDRYNDSAGGGGSAVLEAGGSSSSLTSGSGGGLGEFLGGRGLELVDVSGVDLSGESMATDHDRSAVDYRWLVEKWDTVVAPGVGRGMTREDFVQRDATANAPEGRRLAQVFDVMVGSGSVSVSVAADGRIEVNGGRHRVLAAQQLGIRFLPARVHRAGR